MEACGAGHHWGWMLTGLGHTVRLIAPEAVKPFVKKGKNDATDAAAICEAASRPEVKFVPVKSLEQQGILALHTARALLIRQRTMLGNAIRGLATEFGLTVAKGIEKLDELVALVGADETIPTVALHAIAALRGCCNDLVEGIEIFEAKIVAHARHDEAARRVATIPGIGPITASLIAASVVDIGLFKTARQFAAWRGLAWCLDKAQLAGKRAWVESPRQAIGRSGHCWCWEPPRWFTEPKDGTARWVPGSGRSWSGARPGW
jgi:transposase